MRRGKCHHFWTAQKAHPCAELPHRSRQHPRRLARLGRGRCLLAPTTHPTSPIYLCSLAATQSGRYRRSPPLALLHCTTQVAFSVHSKKMQELLGKSPAFHRQQRFSISARFLGGLGELPLPLPAWEGGSCLACVSRNARWLCVCWGSLPELPPDGAIARLHC